MHFKLDERLIVDHGSDKYKMKFNNLSIGLLQSVIIIDPGLPKS